MAFADLAFGRRCIDHGIQTRHSQQHYVDGIPIPGICNNSMLCSDDGDRYGGGGGGGTRTFV